MLQCFMIIKLHILEKLNQVRKCIINSFHKTIPHSRILVSLSIIDDLFLKFPGNEIENIFGNFHDPIENILNMLSFEKFMRDDQEADKPILNDDDQE